MKTWAALFRGINVGGNNILPMKELVATLESVGCQDVETYIQSGNTVFRSEEEDASLLSDRIRTAVEESHGFEPRVLVLGAEELERVVRSNPFPEAESEPKSLHVYFLASSPERPDLDALEGIKGDRERFVLEGDTFYLNAPDGVGRSKLAAKAEKLLGVSATARNWRTVVKLSAMARQRD
ncbi:MAG: DUF1697 domain-containing protein [Rubrobacteraceae bacterium]|nr:DUF1697 domain-containing protein [Rubrobacteraceae bacterium]